MRQVASIALAKGGAIAFGFFVRKLYVLTGKPEVAARLIGWSDATRKEIGDPRPRTEQADLDRDIAAIKVKLGVPSI